jgi:glycosyltransferase involved in cell wall biosynthesis
MSERPTVGVHVRTAGHLLDTVASLENSQREGVQVFLLVDGPNAELAATLEREPALVRLTKLVSAKAEGAPHWFNELASLPHDGAIVFLESGTVLGPRCLDLLVGALDRQRCGLAGPSTNRSWNEQGVFRRSGAHDVARTEALACQRFGTSRRSLAPLYSLGDFCFAVSRAVIEAIGGADRAYGSGPCWEMDYNVRAARAGFAAVWVGGAYAYRHPPDPGREHDAGQMERAKHLYQDRFCGLRLEGAEKVAYELHCRGDACEHFAPRERIELRRPLSAQAEAAAAQGTSAPSPQEPERTRDRLPATLARPTTPLVTAIMPTRGRPDFAMQAVRYFLAQDYGRKELVVLEDGEPQLTRLLPDDGRVRHVTTKTSGRSIGAMRNEACGLARGDIIAHWDDDDWYGPERLSRQVAPLISGEADVTALRDSLMFDLPNWRFWRCKPDLHRRLFVRDVHGGTLVYRRQVWKEKAQFPNRSLAEDAIFLELAVRRGARLVAVEAGNIFLYVRHGSNAWDLACGRAGGASGWALVPEPDFLGQSRPFYAARSPAVPAERSGILVSCVMPTFDRRNFVAQAARYFLEQDYPAKELVVVDDSPEPVGDLLPGDTRIRYHRVDGKMVLGLKRNLACELARGTVIAHWDDDDWASRDRLSVQVKALSSGGADICGSGSILYFDPATSSAWRFVWPPSGRPWAAGPSLCFTKDFWSRVRFPEVAIGEDTRFVFNPAVRRVADVAEANCVVGIIHRRNTAAKSVHGRYWEPRPVREVEELLGEDMTFYRQLATAS